MPPKRSLEELVTTFQEQYVRKVTCKVCDSPSRELIEILMRAGHGGPKIAHFLRTELDESIGEATLSRHKAQHLNATEID